MSSRAPPEPLILYSTWRGRLASFVTPTIVLAIGIVALVVGGRPHPVPIVIVFVGAVLAGTALFDYPWRAEFGAAGINRRCLLRRHHLPWERVEVLRRAPGPRFRRMGNKDNRSPLAIGLGGLTACRGRRRYLLVDTAESSDEWTQLRAVLAAWGPGVRVQAAPPPDGISPTWLYHERGRRD